ncbi:hypothetical protein [Rhodococcoides corynebacterioides]|uniref:Uncharacterized protein n=1 Tax=Rhodococcoides corynebacterioides TaxID=53972 RepID=A0ABS7NZV8_9NOCA|nr:hypothetical protein [Rhodococcus corynebacterioides]MBY6365669.1 hypothetical protein [Rhodococcus corynebacterioides]MBY6406400.1 hypothetical protein [Rhodococcus corynebacterioides]
MYEFVDEWTLPLLPESGLGAPTQMVDACFAVGSDLRWRRHGANLDIDRLQWTISVLETGDIHLGVHSDGPRPRARVRANSNDDRTVGVTVGAGLHMDQSLADATVLVADIVQTKLAGYPPWIQWPIEEKRLLLPTIVDGEAMWRDPRTDRSVASIGLLAD